MSGDADDDAAVTGQSLVARELRRHRERAGLSQIRLARLVGYSRTYIWACEKPGTTLVSEEVVKRIDDVLNAGGALIALRARAHTDHVARRHRAARGIRERGTGSRSAQVDESSDVAAADSIGNHGPDIEGLTALSVEICGSDTDDHSITDLDGIVVALAEAHTQAPPVRVLREVLRLHAQVQAVLRGRLRLSQRRELYRIESDLLAHACVLLGDLRQDVVAEHHGRAALTYAREAGADQARARSALAKTLRWQERYVESADMARKGFEGSSNTAVRVQLASQEANAAALLGHGDRAVSALDRARLAAETAPADTGMSAWSFPVPRQALFAQSVATHTGDPAAALTAADDADACWLRGAPRVPATWAQIRVGAALAHLANGDLDAAVDQAETMLGLEPELRVSTVTAYVTNLERALAQSRFAGTRTTRELSSRCHEFTSAALPRSRPPGGS